MPFLRHRCRLLREDDATPCLKVGLVLKSAMSPPGVCEGLPRWWPGERQQNGAGGANAYQMPFSVPVFSVKMQTPADRSLPEFVLPKIIFP